MKFNLCRIISKRLVKPGSSIMCCVLSVVERGFYTIRTRTNIDEV